MSKNMNKEFLTIVYTFDNVYQTKFNKTFDNNVEFNFLPFFPLLNSRPVYVVGLKYEMN